MEPSELALFWAGVIAIAILLYVVLDGFDIGVGILFGTTPDEAKRGQMLTSIAPFWDGNETWLVVVGASLFAAFPAVYACFSSLLPAGPADALRPDLPGASPSSSAIAAPACAGFGMMDSLRPCWSPLSKVRQSAR
jgi:hypothetical protein